MHSDSEQSLHFPRFKKPTLFRFLFCTHLPSFYHCSILGLSDVRTPLLLLLLPAIGLVKRFRPSFLQYCTLGLSLAKAVTAPRPFAWLLRTTSFTLAQHCASSSLSPIHSSPSSYCHAPLVVTSTCWELFFVPWCRFNFLLVRNFSH